MRHLVFPINALPSVQMVETGIADILWSADLKFEALKRYYEQIKADVLFYFNDVAIQAEAMGARVKYFKEKLPAIESSAQSFSVPNPHDVSRMRVNADVLKRMEKDFPSKYRAAPIYGPFTVAGQMAGEPRILKWIAENPQMVMSILAKTFECARHYAAYLIEAGANLLWISDPLAALIPPDKFWDFSGDFLARLFDFFPDIPSILHICGDTGLIVDEMVSTGVRGISFDNCIELLTLEDKVPDDVYIIGNIDPVEVIELGSGDDVVSCTSDLAYMMGLKDNFVLSTGCAVPPFAPIENIRLFVETGKKSLAKLLPHTSLLSEISQGVYTGECEVTAKRVRDALELGVEPLTIITSGLTRAIHKGSAMYEAKLCFLPALLLMVDAFYKGFQVLEHTINNTKLLEPHIVIGTVKGDIHEIGKNLVRILLETHGHKVIDLGADVSADTFIEAYWKYRPPIIGLSAFTTESRKEMANVINSFRREEIKEPFFIVGGAATNSEVSRTIGANGYARDAVRAVALVEKLLKR